MTKAEKSSCLGGCLEISPISNINALHLLIRCLIYTSSTAEGSKEWKKHKPSGEQRREELLIRCYSNQSWQTCTSLPLTHICTDRFDWSDCQLSVPLSALSLALPPLASSWVCRHTISASLEARSCCSSEISACGGSQSRCLWTGSIFQVSGCLWAVSVKQLSKSFFLKRNHF